MTTSAAPDRRADIVRVALDVLEESGLEATSLRAVAGKLGVRMNTVLWHVKTKARLRELMADAILDSIGLDGLPEDPRERVVELAHRYRAALLAHRDGGRVVAGTFTSGPGTLGTADALIGALTGLGLDDRQADWTCWTIVYFAIGLVVEEQGSAESPKLHLESPATLERYPHLRRVLLSEANDRFDDRFAFGLDLILTSASAPR
ncbi:MAG TPA: TetR/AcrR family transcriptional regulator C-terminal domain-containing protein [Amycolatopsis sp.]